MTEMTEKKCWVVLEININKYGGREINQIVGVGMSEPALKAAVYDMNNSLDKAPYVEYICVERILLD